MMAVPATPSHIRPIVRLERVRKGAAEPALAPPRAAPRATPPTPEVDRARC